MLVFLDFDGVLHPVSGSTSFNPDSIKELEKVVIEFSFLEIVITSSWRQEKSIVELTTLLGPVLGLMIIGTTPVIDDPFLHHVRFHEVCTYLDTLPKSDRVWVAIDVEPGYYPKDALVLITECYKGFTQDEHKTLISLIKSQEVSSKLRVIIICGL